MIEARQRRVGMPQPLHGFRGWQQAGLSLIELVMFIMVISLGLAGVLLVMNYTSRRSADPMIREQALLIAESYMEEILVKKFIDPTGGTTRTCPTAEGGRTNYDNVCDYNGLSDVGARDQFGNAITGLENYNVAVTVSGGAGISLGPSTNLVANTGSVRVLRVDITVTHGGVPDFSLPLTGYRTHYNCSNDSDPQCKPL
jgi:MSHA pilin protein MshD